MRDVRYVNADTPKILLEPLDGDGVVVVFGVSGIDRKRQRLAEVGAALELDSSRSPASDLVRIGEYGRRELGGKFVAVNDRQDVDPRIAYASKYFDDLACWIEMLASPVGDCGDDNVTIAGPALGIHGHQHVPVKRSLARHQIGIAPRAVEDAYDVRARPLEHLDDRAFWVPPSGPALDASSHVIAIIRVVQIRRSNEKIVPTAVRDHEPVPSTSDLQPPDG
jgi:hypothetical protein